ncbi:hypothetical protein DOT_5650 [Desulfosporosinus sp. OT]|nr:hypothetical protein DOT_5650 [Desulfosporosinus sp. OT]
MLKSLNLVVSVTVGCIVLVWVFALAMVSRSREEAWNRMDKRKTSGGGN